MHRIPHTSQPRIAYDGKLLTAPKIQEKISDGKAVISGMLSLKQATRMADR